MQLEALTHGTNTRVLEELIAVGRVAFAQALRQQNFHLLTEKLLRGEPEQLFRLLIDLDDLAVAFDDYRRVGRGLEQRPESILGLLALRDVVEPRDASGFARILDRKKRDQAPEFAAVRSLETHFQVARRALAVEALHRLKPLRLVGEAVPRVTAEQLLHARAEHLGVALIHVNQLRVGRISGCDAGANRARGQDPQQTSLALAKRRLGFQALGNVAHHPGLAQDLAILVKRGGGQVLDPNERAVLALQPVLAA